MPSTNNGSNQPSTLGSYVQSATGAVQNAIGSLTGNPVDKREAADRHTAAANERDASKAGASVGPFNVAASGVTVDNEDRTRGKKDQTVGSGKEFVGNLMGNKELAREGERQNQEGQGREAAGQIKDYVGGAADRVTGAIGSAAAGVTGNTDAQKAYQNQHDTGKTDVRGVQGELRK